MKKKLPIRFNAPLITGQELRNIEKVIESGQLSGNHFYTQECQALLKKLLACGSALLTHSGTGALEMAAILCDIKPGDEVIMPSFTFVSTANAFVLHGATPVFVDVRKRDLTINTQRIECAITDQTKAIVPVHYAGNSCDMNSIMNIAQDHNLFVIEDAAHSLLSTYKNKHLGSIGHLGCLSFHETKNVTSGEGGALLVNDSMLHDRARIIWEKGTNRQDFLTGKVNQYTWVDVGSSFLPSEITAAFLLAQLQCAQKIKQQRLRLCAMYRERLKPLETQGRIELLALPEFGCANGHIFYLLTADNTERSMLIRYLAKHSIKAIFHYVPLHDSPAGLRYGRTYGSLPVTENVSLRLLRLPLHAKLTETDIDIISDRILEFYKHKGNRSPLSSKF